MPDEIDAVNPVLLNAVYERLLPNERRKLLPMLRERLAPGGTLLINRIPHRWAPSEGHFTGLWFVNDAPRVAAHRMAHAFSRINPQVDRSRNWDVHLRGGIRGGTEREVPCHRKAR